MATEQKGFFDWLGSNFFYWAITILSGILLGYKDGIIGILGSCVGSAITFGVIFGVFYLMKKANVNKR